MKFEREKDITAFKGKSWREKWVLHYRAQELDPWILRLRMLMYFFVYAPIWTSSFCLASQFFPHLPLPAAIVIGIVVAFPIDIAFHSVFIVPRIRKALDSGIRSAA